MNRLQSSGSLLAVLILSSCAVGPDYKRPAVDLPAAFPSATAGGTGSFADTAWWQIYKDPHLNELIRTAFADGYDVRIAASRVEQARAVAAQIHGQRFPGLGYNANADRGKNAILGNASTLSGGAVTNGFDAYLGAAWEFDLWGRVRRLDEAARSQYLASEEARRAVMLSLVSDVATAYFDLLEIDEELAIARRATESFGASLALFKQQLEGGVVSRLDTASAEAAMATSAARIPDLERQIAIKENQINVLLGHNPGPIVRGARLSDQGVLPDVPAGLPSALLERRPDIRQAEEAAHAANAGIGVTVGGFLPRIGLSAILGGVSERLQDITSHDAGLWSVGAEASGPLFQGGGLRGQYEEAKQAWEEAKLRYQLTALNAFREVADTLVTRQKLVEEREQQEQAVRAYGDAVMISTQRYTAGRASYYEVLQAQQQLFPAEVSLAQTRHDQLVAIVQLYKVLGGGWNLDAAQWAGSGAK
jgi:multidrug efflux system outer membrane protein